MKNLNLTIPIYDNALIIVLLTIYFFFLPLIVIVTDLREPALYNGDIPQFTFRWHHNLSDQFEDWARGRVNSGQATTLSVNNSSGTEWPMFSAVYYLWATEALQQAWDENPALFSTAPTRYADGAITAAAALVADPNHATWVKQHWGNDYLYQENIFYRMLLISGLTSYQTLLKDDKYESTLATQVRTLSYELDNSPYGLLDDYPGQCYPIDVLPAIAAIKRADNVLGSDHTTFVGRSIRGFSDTRLDRTTNLPAYIANAKTGQGIGPARGVGISYMLIWAPELWPETARNWYHSYETHFWQDGLLISGVREFSKNSDAPRIFFDIDVGPIVGGYGTAASAFGIGATRTNGRFEHAYPLSTEAIVATWPLLDGTLLGPRLLSNLSDAPYIGETALLFNFTRRPLVTDSLTLPNAQPPMVVYLGLLLYLICGCVGIVISASKLKGAQIAQSTNGLVVTLIGQPVIGIFG